MFLLDVSKMYWTQCIRLKSYRMLLCLCNSMIIFNYNFIRQYVVKFLKVVWIFDKNRIISINFCRMTAFQAIFVMEKNCISQSFLKKNKLFRISNLIFKKGKCKCTCTQWGIKTWNVSLNVYLSTPFHVPKTEHKDPRSSGRII